MVLVVPWRLEKLIASAILGNPNISLFVAPPGTRGDSTNK
jgi:hypothetical protein